MSSPPYSLTGQDLATLMSVLVWMKDCPFSKAEKPDLGASLDELNLFYDRLLAVWVEMRDAVGVTRAQATRVAIEFSELEIDWLRGSLLAVLDECRGDPLELELRAGTPADVERLAKEFSPEIGMPHGRDG